MIRKTQAALAIAALFAAPAFAAVSLDANVELDTTYQNANRGASQSGRVELNAASKSEKGGGFVAARASHMAGKGGATTVDDMWVQFGNASGDIKLEGTLELTGPVRRVASRIFETKAEILP